MSTKQTRYSVFGSGGVKKNLKVAQFTGPMDWSKLKAPISMIRKLPEPDEPRQHAFGNRVMFEAPKVDPSQYPVVLQDSNGKRYTGNYQAEPYTCVALVREGTKFRVHPVHSWFKFGSPTMAPTTAPDGTNNVSVQPNTAMRLNRIADKMLSGLKEEIKEDPTIGRGAYDEMDVESDFSDDEEVKPQEEVDEEKKESDIALPKKLSRYGRELLDHLKTEDPKSEHDFSFLYELIDQDPDEYRSDEEDEIVDKNGDDTGSSINSKKRKATEEAEGQPPSKRPKISEVNTEKSKQDLRTIRDSFRTGFRLKATMEIGELLNLCKTNISGFNFSGTTADSPEQKYWKQLFIDAAKTYLDKKGTKFTLKAKYQK